MPKDLFGIGTPRGMLLAEYGAPTSSEVREDGLRYETFAFAQVYGDAGRIPRAMFRCLLSVRNWLQDASRQHQHPQNESWFHYGTACIAPPEPWKPAVAFPAGVVGGLPIAYQVRYDDHDNVEQVILLN